MKAGDTEANFILDKLLEMKPAECQTVIQVAREYGDHPYIVGIGGLPAGKKLLMQLQWALGELGYVSFDYPVKLRKRR